MVQKLTERWFLLNIALKSGDSIEILTSKSQTPSKDWLNLVKSSRARTKIKQWLLKVERDNNQVLGEEILEKAFKVYGTNLKVIRKKNELEKAIQGLKFRSEEELFINVGSGKYNPKDVVAFIPRLEIKEEVKEEKEKEIDTYYNKLHEKVKKTTHKDNAVIVDGLDDVWVRMGEML